VGHSPAFEQLVAHHTGSEYSYLPYNHTRREYVGTAW
jgi:hypothetical protein